MWPFAGGLLASVRLDLKVFEGESYGVATYPSCPRSRWRFNAANGDQESRNNLAAWVQRDPDAWIHSDAKDPDIFDSSKYEVRLINVTGYTAGMQGDTYYVGDPGDEVGWIDLDTHTEWRLNWCGDNDEQTAAGDMQIREKAQTTNKASGAVTFRSEQNGPS